MGSNVAPIRIYHESGEYRVDVENGIKRVINSELSSGSWKYRILNTDKENGKVKGLIKEGTFTLHLNPDQEISNQEIAERIIAQYERSKLPKEDRVEMLKPDYWNPAARAIALVHALFYNEPNQSVPISDVYIVWQVTVLKNWKCLVSTNVKDNRYYEVTYDGNIDMTYVDAYVKVENFSVDRFNSIRMDWPITKQSKEG